MKGRHFQYQTDIDSIESSKKEFRKMCLKSYHYHKYKEHGKWTIYLGLAWKIQHFFKLIGFPLTTFLLDYKQHFCIF